MAISKKGFRSITVKGRKFYWKFNSKVIVVSEEKKSNQLIIDFGWYDDWLFAADQDNSPSKFYPKEVTPKFVSESISYGLSKGWKEGTMRLQYRDGVYEIKS